MDGTGAKAPLPAVATPRSQLKRKRHEIVDLTGHDDDDTFGTSRLVSGGAHDTQLTQKRWLEDDEEDGSSDEGSMYEDILDNIELNPYIAVEGATGLSAEDAARLRVELRQIGPELFVQRFLTSKVMAPRLLGTAFGMTPDLDVDDDIFIRILAAAIIRMFHKRQKLPQYNTINDAAHLLRSSQKIMVITGAGISTSLGIPDFRSKDTGFYDQVRSLGYNEGEEIFDIIEFDRDPSIFYSLAGDILPGLKRFSPTHAFIKLLQDRGRLQTNFTQNIDNLEELAGIDRARLIQCHGSFATASCRKCRNQVPGRAIFPDIRAKRVAHCKRCVDEIARQPKPPPAPKRKPSKFKLRKNDWESSSEEEDDMPQPGVMKPDITFFHEQLPDRFFDRFTERDSKSVDLVVVIGTSLKVAPVSEMPNYLPGKVPHIFISREPIEHVNFDIQLLGECDHVVFELCRRAGWSLRHEMIPKGFEVKVAPVEGSEYRWTVTPANKKEGGIDKQPAQTAGLLTPA